MDNNVVQRSSVAYTLKRKGKKGRWWWWEYLPSQILQVNSFWL